MDTDLIEREVARLSSCVGFNPLPPLWDGPVWRVLVKVDQGPWDVAHVHVRNARICGDAYMGEELRRLADRLTLAEALAYLWAVPLETSALLGSTVSVETPQGSVPQCYPADLGMDAYYTYQMSGGRVGLVKLEAGERRPIGYTHLKTGRRHYWTPENAPPG